MASQIGRLISKTPYEWYWQVVTQSKGVDQIEDTCVPVSYPTKEAAKTALLAAHSGIQVEKS